MSKKVKTTVLVVVIVVFVFIIGYFIGQKTYEIIEDATRVETTVQHSSYGRGSYYD